ncbi:MAG: PAS domain S-box protein [Burkholderiales bacterium]|nr:PAS domain S-box protein [Burkholderiales bacterium]
MATDDNNVSQGGVSPAPARAKTKRVAKRAAPVAAAAPGASKAADEAVRIKGALDGTSTAVMMVDRDFKIIYVNNTTRAMLRKYSDVFRKQWPSFDPDKMIGSCIDMFHKNPSHQRTMLADPSRLPFNTDISIGDLKFALCVNASYDARGAYVGNVLEWADVTEVRSKEAMIKALDRALATVEFTLEGRILNANANFLNVVGYSLDEIRGQHHSMFVGTAYRNSNEYRQFWEKLARGEYDAGRYERVAKGGREVWIQGSYNPILDFNGKPFKVVKYATDITDQVLAERTLQSAVEETQAVVEAAKAGDLGERISLDGKSGSIEALCSGVNALVDSMADVVSQIRESSDAINTAAKEIAAGNSDLSQRTEQQAASLEETASSMEELTSTVKQNAENARQANQLAIGASEVATKGGKVVHNVVQTMGAIAESSKKIADIISVIDGIAFQTNILALNAAVEAARAGEQGRGFAVVATEVRNLAQRSAAAAKEIKTLISDSVGKVETGSVLVNEAGKTMEEVVTSVKRVTDIISEITAASVEQSSGIEQVNQAVVQMDEVTQQNAALVEEAAAAAESLEEQAQSLSVAVSAFKLGADDFAPPPATRTAAPLAERRQPNRPTNVARLPNKPPVKAPARPAVKPARTAAAAGGSSDGEWSEF